MSSFALAYVLSLTILLLLALWSVVDCSFRWIPNLVGQDLRLRFLADPHLRQLHTWQIHGPRLLLFAVLTLLGTISAGVVGTAILADAHVAGTGRRILLAVGLIAVTLALITSWKSLGWWAFRFRIRRRLDALKAAVETLSAQWPADRIVLPGLGSYEASRHDPDLLYIEGKCPNGLTDFYEAFDRISRHAERGFSFAVGSYPACWIHYLTEGHAPGSYSRDVLGTSVVYSLQQAIALERRWWLACYAVSVQASGAAQTRG